MEIPGENTGTYALLQEIFLTWVKGETVPDSLPATPKSPPTRRVVLSCFSSVRLCVTLWTAAHQAPLSTGLLRQAAGPEAELSVTGYAGGDSPGGAEA